MASIENTKVAAALLTAGIVFMLAGQAGKVLIHSERPHATAIPIPALPGAAPAAAPAAPAAPEPISALLAEANVANGQVIANRLCAACHSFNDGGRNGVGPNLYGIMGAPRAEHAGFSYSAALKGKTGSWSYEEMGAWLAAPARYAPGTRMAFAGLARVQERADVVAYLRSLAATPMALPAAAPAAAAAPAPAAAPAAAAPLPAAPAVAPAAAADLPPIAPLLANADVAAGQRLFMQQCAICHTFNEGGRAGVGPNLYNVVGGPHAHMEGYNYTAALKAHQGPWDYEELNRWLYRPMVYAPGTRMIFMGLPEAQQRANVIAWLRTLAAEPKPLP